jgi:hypothetical protein
MANDDGRGTEKKGEGTIYQSRIHPLMKLPAQSLEPSHDLHVGGVTAFEQCS